MGGALLEEQADVADLVPDVLEADVLLVGQEGVLLAVVVAAGLVLVAQEEDGLEDGLRGGELLAGAALNEVVEVVVAERDDAALAGRQFARVEQAALVVAVGLELDLLDEIALAAEAEWQSGYIFCRASWRMMISSTFCLTLSNRNWYCSFSMREIGSLPKISFTVSNSPSSRSLRYEPCTICSTSSSFVVSASRFSYFIID